MITREQLIKAEFKIYERDLYPPVYYKIQGKRAMIYKETDGGEIYVYYDGLEKYVSETIKEWIK